MVKNILLKFSFLFLSVFLFVNSAFAFYTIPPAQTLLDIPVGYMVGEDYYSTTSVTTFEYPAGSFGVLYDGGEVVSDIGAGFSFIPEKSGYYNFLIKTKDNNIASWNTYLVVQSFENSLNRSGEVDYFAPSIDEPLEYPISIAHPVNTTSDTANSYLSLYSVYLSKDLVYFISASKGNTSPSSNAFQIVVRPAQALGRYVVSTGMLNFGSETPDYRLYPFLSYYMPQDMKPFVFYSDFLITSANFSSVWNNAFLEPNLVLDSAFVSSPTTDGKNLNLIGPTPDDFTPFESLYFSFFFPNASSTPPAFTDDGLNYQIAYKECGLDNFGGCFYNAFVDIFSSLFIPKVWNYEQLLNDSELMQKIPFSVYSKIVDFKDSLKSLGDENSPYSSLDLLGVYELKPLCQLDYIPSWFCPSVKSVLSFMLYVILAKYLWIKIRYFF